MEGEWSDIQDRTGWTPQQLHPGRVPAGDGREGRGWPGPGPRWSTSGCLTWTVGPQRYAAGQAGAARRPHRAGPVHGLRRRAAVRPGASRPPASRIAATSSSKNARPFLERIRVDTFAAEQRLDYDVVHEGMTLEDLFDADMSGRDFPQRQARPDAIFLTAADGARPGTRRSASSSTTRRSGIQRRQGGRAWPRSGSPASTTGELLSEAGADLVVHDPGRRLGPGADRPGSPGGAAGRRARCDAGVPSGRRVCGRWSTRASTPPARGCGRRCARWATGTSSPAARCPEAEADDVHYPGTYVAGLYNRLASRDRRARRSRTRTWSTSPNWLPLRFRIVGGPVVRRRRRRGRWSTAWSWTCAAGTLTRRLDAGSDAEGRRTSDRPAAACQHEGRAPGRPGDDLHRRELVGHASRCRSGLDGRVRQRGGQALPRPGRPAPHGAARHGEVDAETIDLQVETTQSHVRVALAARTRAAARRHGRPGRAAGSSRSRGSSPTSSRVELEQGRPATVEKVVALYTSRDRAISESR